MQSRLSLCLFYVNGAKLLTYDISSLQEDAPYKRSTKEDKPGVEGEVAPPEGLWKT